MFLRPPKECEKPKGWVWQVIKSIYGLKTAPKAWKHTLCSWLRSQSLRPGVYDDSVWVCEATGVVVLIDVDDLVVTGSDVECVKLLTALRGCFECTNWVALISSTELDPLVFWGHQLWVEKGRLVISQTEYVKCLMQRFGMQNAKGLASLPSDEFETTKLAEAESCSAEEHSWYRSVLGGVRSLALGSRADLAAAVGVLSEGQAAPTVKHIAAAKKLLRYVRETGSRRLELCVPQLDSGGRVDLCVEFDANFGHARARSGICMFIGDTLCYWGSRRQRCIVLSTAEAELVAASQAAKELQGTFNFLSDVFSRGQSA